MKLPSACVAILLAADSNSRALAKDKSDADHEFLDVLGKNGGEDARSHSRLAKVLEHFAAGHAAVSDAVVVPTDFTQVGQLSNLATDDAAHLPRGDDDPAVVGAGADEEGEFVKYENTTVAASGVNRLPAINKDALLAETSIPLDGEVETEDDAERVCLSRCDDLPGCDVVTFYSFNDGPYECSLYDSNQGPLFSVDATGLEQYNPDTTYIREGIEPLPEYEGCNFPPSGTAENNQRQAALIGLGLMCHICHDLNIPAPYCASVPKPVCDRSLSEDFNTYVQPAINCVSEAVGYNPASFQTCLNCAMNPEATASCSLAAESICLDGPDSLISGICASVCPIDGECKSKVQSAMLCALSGTDTEETTDAIFPCLMSGARHGFDENLDYQCPEVE